MILIRDSALDETFRNSMSMSVAQYGLVGTNPVDARDFFDWYLKSNPPYAKHLKERVDGLALLDRGFPINILVHALFGNEVASGRVEVCLKDGKSVKLAGLDDLTLADARKFDPKLNRLYKKLAGLRCQARIKGLAYEPPNFSGLFSQIKVYQYRVLL